MQWQRQRQQSAGLLQASVVNERPLHVSGRGKQFYMQITDHSLFTDRLP